MGVGLPVILAVDDEPDNLSAIRRCLRGQCEVLCAASGPEALRLLGEREVHLVISDLRMPEMSGVELLEQARLVAPRAQRVILSAFSDAAELLDAINRGSVLRYLLKPISAATLRQLVEDVLAGQPLRSSEQVALITSADGEPPLHDALARLGVAAAAWQADQAPPGIVVLDLDRREVAPDPLLAALSRAGGELLLVTSPERFDVALALVRNGAAGILRKPLQADEAHRALERALHRRRLAREIDEARRGAEGPLGELAGQSPAMRKLVQALASVAQIDSTVLLRGETGTGKEVAARALHRASARRDGPFVAVHCAALTGTLLESELFGHEKGAFTGAAERRQGRFERASGGTLFLDEVGDIPLETQVKLLRVLQERVIERVGGREPVPVDVRVVAATHRDLEALIAAGQFRHDLYYRLKVIPIDLPPLRERREDIAELACRFSELHQQAMRKRNISLGPELRRKLEARRWPGNVRELRNEIERLVAFTPSDSLIDAALFPDEGAEPAGKPLAYDDRGTIHEIMDRLEGEVVRSFLERYHWNQTACAERLGVTRQALAKKLQKLNIVPPDGK